MTNKTNLLTVSLLPKHILSIILLACISMQATSADSSWPQQEVGASAAGFSEAVSYTHLTLPTIYSV